jgi:DNA primase
MITPETIDRVREAADIVDVIGEHVKLRRAGADFRGPCPFHGGKNPNFSVSTRRNAYHCFKCGVSGDVFTFVRERLGLEFVEAVKYVAARAGVEVKEERRGEQAADPREPLWEANAAAAEFFRDTLWIDDEAKGAREYLESRDIDRAAADRYELGYAPRDGARLRAHLNAMGYDDARLLAAGLLVQREGQDEPRSRFWARLMIPILDASGRHVGFGGRVIGEGEPKYLNSAESEIFSKGRLLYGLSGARHAIRKADRALVVEGYFDAIRLALAGVDETVAPLGTALTEQQAALLAKLTKNVFLLYDSDEAGLKATFRAGRELLRHGVAARVASLPEGEDPDTFVRTHGAKGLETQLLHAVDIFERQLMEVQRRGMFDELHKKRVAIDRLLPTLRATSDPLTKDMYVGRLAEAARVDRDVLLRELAQPDPEARRGTAPRTVSREAGSPPPPRPAPSSGGDGIEYVEPPRRRDEWERGSNRARSDRRRGFRRTEDRASSHAVARVSPSAGVYASEKGLTQAMLQDHGQVELVVERWGPEHFHHPVYRRIFERLLAAEEPSLDTVVEGLSAAEVEVVNALVAEPLPNPATHVQAWLRKLELRAIKEESERINAMLMDPEHPLSEAEKDALVARKQQLVIDRAALSPR